MAAMGRVGRAERLVRGVVGKAIVSSALLSAAVAVAACGGGSGGGANVPNAAVRVPLEVYDYALPNGVRVILDEDRAAPVVAINVWYKVGSKDDPPGRAGFAHLFEHLMFQGTRSIEGNVFPAMQQAGATRINASTSSDRTEYHALFPATSLEWALWFEAERMASMGDRLDQATFERERNVVKNELRQNYENVESGFMRAICWRAIFGKEHPYGHATIGTLEELDAASLEEVRAFHKRYYQPSNAIVSLVGDFDRKQAGAWIAKHFGAVPNAPSPPLRRAPEPKLAGERRVVVEANVAYPRVMVAYPVPPDGAAELKALEAMMGFVAGGFQHLLIGERGLGRAVRTDLDARMLGSVATFTAILGKDGDPVEAVRILDKVIFEFEPGRFGSINTGLNIMKVSRLFDFESFAERAEMYAQYDDLKQNPLFIARELEAIQNTTPGDAFAARQRFLQTKNRAVIVVRPSPNAPFGGRVVEGG